MKGIAPLLFIGGGLVLAYLYLTGALPGFGEGVPTGKGPDLGNAEAKADAFIGSPEFITMCVAAALASLGMMTWRRIGGWGRATVLVCVAVVVTVVVMRWQ